QRPPAPLRVERQHPAHPASPSTHSFEKPRSLIWTVRLRSRVHHSQPTLGQTLGLNPILPSDNLEFCWLRKSRLPYGHPPAPPRLISAQRQMFRELKC